MSKEPSLPGHPLARTSEAPAPDDALRSLLWSFVIATSLVLASSSSEVASPNLIGIDKLAHFAFYGLLATQVQGSRLSQGKVWRTILLVSLFGATDEIHQAFTPGRSVEFGDWLADTLGASCGAFLYARCTGWRNWLRRPLWGPL